jgi:sugar phosphate permease
MDIFSKISTIINRKRYTNLQLQILFFSIVGYATFYLLRQNFSIAIFEIEKEFKYSKTNLGWILTIFSITYGIGRLINGYICDHLSARIFIVLGLLGSAITNIFIGFTSTIFFLTLLWGLNGWFQSMGWAPCARLLICWFNPNILGVVWSIWSSSHQIGNISAIVLTSFLIKNLGWRYAFFIPSIITLFIILILLNQLRRDSPTISNLYIKKINEDELTPELDQIQMKISHLKETFAFILQNKFLWYISIANIFLYTIRIGILNWMPTFLREYKGLNLPNSERQLIIFEIGGLLGGLTVGWISNKIFNRQYNIVAIVYLLVLFFSILALWKVPTEYQILNRIFLIFSGLLSSGIQVLMSISIASYFSNKNIGIVTGFAGMMGHIIGSTIAGVGVGSAIDIYGWQGGLLIFLGSVLCGAFCFFLAYKCMRHELNLKNNLQR